MNRRMIAPGALLKASASLLADGSADYAAALRAGGEPCCGLGAAEDESILGFMPNRRAERSSLLLSASDFRLHSGI